MRYFKNSDKGTKFFHDMIKRNKDKRQIMSLNLSDGTRTTSNQEVSNAFVNYYKELLGTGSNCVQLDKDILLDGKLVQEEQANVLIRDVLDGEIKEALFSIGEMTKGDVPSVQLLVDKLDSFGACYGLKINISKSNIFAAGVAREEVDIMKSNTGFSVGRFPFRYLGLPVAATRLSIAQFNPFMDRIASSIRAWAGMTLSYAGRCELIKSILQGVECFWLASLPIPAGAKVKKIGLACTVYYLWEARNLRIFEGKTKHPEAIVRGIQIQVFRVIEGLYSDAVGPRGETLS
ncbi:hypothetical protein Acr_20g0002670 [Actinidia rufa]|uniref:Uncharacterized protein n=1 Tax=Actinidia rufa TaxID=165716 RepID=A0A7J0GCE1_9ERIC|nr:hypothetical protein Acr_20g0002670 [Actinidia rufa]